MKIELELSEKNECTSYPYWVIIDPQMAKTYQTVQSIAACESGLFFSRDHGESYLASQQHNYSKEARVYCKSGHHSWQYREAYHKAKDIQNKIGKITFEQAIAEFRKNDQQRFKVKMENDVNLIGTLRYIMHYSSLDALINKEFEFYNEEKSTST